jgi:hypothetical protein
MHDTHNSQIQETQQGLYETASREWSVRDEGSDILGHVKAGAYFVEDLGEGILRMFQGPAT